MSTIQLPGLATGIDTAALVQQLMIIESRRLASYQVKKADYQEQNTAFTELRTRVNALKSAASALSDANDLEVFNTTSSDKDMLTANASSNANPGSHSIEINQLATSETWIQDTSTFDYETDYVGGGTFIYSYNYKEREITAVADVTTLEDFVGLINNDVDNPGVTASLLYHDGKYHLMLNGNETGTDYQISINESNTEVWEMKDTFTEDSENATLSTKITELGQFTENSGLVGDEQIQITGTDHDGVAIDQVEFDLTEYTTLSHLLDEIEGAFDENVKATLENGKIVVTDTVAGTSSLTVILTYDQGTGDTELTLPDEAGDWDETAGGATSESLSSLLSTSFAETQSAQDSEIKVDGYPVPRAGIAEEQTLTPTTPASSGTFTLTYGGQTTAEIAYNASTTAIQSELEALSNVNTDDIMVGGTRLNQADATTFTFRDTAGDVSMISINSGNLTPSDPSNYVFTEQTKGDNYGWIRRNSNSITDVIAGVTLNLHDVTETDDPIEVTVSRNRQAITNKITGLLDAYNGLTSFLLEITEYDDETKEMGILSTNFGVSFVKTQVRNPFFGLASGFDDDTDSFLQASDIGLTVDHHGVMELDQSDFDDAIDEDFMGVLNLLGAVNIGSSDSDTIEFYGASETHTTAGTYDVEVRVSGGSVTTALIKLSSESDWRNATVEGNGALITGDSTFDDFGEPLYPEHSLQLTVDLSVADTFTATVRVRQGLAGALEDVLKDVLEDDGRLDVGVDFIEDRIENLESKIETEEDRLEDIQERLIIKFARLERTLTILQQQMSTVNMLTQLTFGSTWA